MAIPDIWTNYEWGWLFVILFIIVTAFTLVLTDLYEKEDTSSELFKWSWALLVIANFFIALLIAMKMRPEKHPFFLWFMRKIGSVKYQPYPE